MQPIQVHENSGFYWNMVVGSLTEVAISGFMLDVSTC